MQQNTLAPDAAHRPSLPAAATETNKTTLQTKITDSSSQDLISDGSVKAAPPCDECGATIM